MEQLMCCVLNPKGTCCRCGEEKCSTHLRVYGAKRDYKGLLKIRRMCSECIAVEKCEVQEVTHE